MATNTLRVRMGGVTWTTAAIGVSMVGSALWGIWATDKLLALEKRELVTVQLSRIMGDFIEAEARVGRPPDETKMRVQAYLQAVEASVEQLGRQGHTVLVAEAVVAGSTPDLTEDVRADVARRVGTMPDARR
ncbi:TrbI F-type domain-containing protein [Novosphingobium album (ex Liu et al. 2023)]|uniref:TrbI F-type domain-containing protein n=1 Tax=Novosphingobium album (ex Liu et al. 2023) TaxID=3031130 RepID=A0ABT5WT53_9SPHN|nr:TrbI F-type domain-containing protein [Novosphingobium album (ex Liu et al. 2023)]MDE8652243.1 TrbI F-type domain-containing protein [Novosphingobium album (ex Liu et al. 2023)]